MVVRYSCGVKDRYTFTGGGYVTPPAVGRLGTLAQEPDGTFELTYLNGIHDIYDAQGRLILVRDPQGNQHELTYDSRGKLPLIGSSKQSLDPRVPLTVAYNYRLTRIDERAADSTLTGHFLTLAYDEATGRLTSITASDGRTVTYEHDTVTGGTLGNLTRVNGLTGVVSEYGYQDPNDPHNLTHDTPVVGKATIVNTYDDQDRVTQQLNGTRKLNFEYLIPLTKTRFTTTVTDAAGQNPYTEVEEYEFDASGKITKQTDALGHEFRYTLNPAKLYSKRQIWQKTGGTLALFQTVDWTYDSAGNKLTEAVTLDSGETVTRSWTYDHNWIASDQIVSSAAPSKIFRNEYTFVFGADGVPINVLEHKRRRDDGSFQVTTYGYDSRNRLISTTLADGLQSRREYTGEFVTREYFRSGGVDLPQRERRYEYDARGNVTKIWNARNDLTQLTYDDRGRVTSTTDALLQQRLYTYSGLTLIQSENGHTVADGEGQVIKLNYDSRNRLTSVQRKNNAGTFVDYLTYTLDSEGRALSVKDGENRTTLFSYDVRGRVKAVTDPAGKLTQTGYDAAGNTTWIKDALNREVHYEYDDLNRLTATVALGVSPNPRTELSYDAASNLTSVKDPENKVTAYVYDALSRTTSVVQPLSQATQYVYDARNRIDYWVTAQGRKIDYSYLSWGPQNQEDWYATTSSSPSLRSISRSYDLEGNLTSVTDSEIQSTEAMHYSYDVLDRLYDETLEYIPGGDQVLKHRYDRYGNRKQLSHERGTEVANHLYTYDKLNWLTSATLAGASIGISHFANDDWQMVSLPNGVSRSYVYRPNGPVQSITVNGPTGQIAQYSYTYNDVLSVDTYTDSDGMHQYGYDGINRLIQATRPAASGLPNESYSYDKVGNRKDPANPSGWQYDGNNRLSSNPSLTYTYDADGSLAARSDGATFTHNAKNRLTQFSKGTTTATYLHDSFGRRIRKTVNGTTTWFAWDGPKLLAEYDSTGTRTMRYAYLPGSYAPTQIEDANGTYYVHSDHLQAPRLLTDSSAQVVWRARYETYGTAQIQNDPDGNSVSIIYNQRFPGQYADQEAGLYYNYFRDYDATVGRYVQADPAGFSGGINAYAYVHGNPVRLLDPLGLWSVTAELYVAGVGGGVTIGVNPNGSTFVGGRVGIGVGGGVEIDPNGTSPGYGSNRSSAFEIGAYSYGGGFAEVGAAYGPAYAEYGTREGFRDEGLASGLYSEDWDFEAGADIDEGPSGGARISASAGYEFGWVEMQHEQFAGCMR